MKDFCAQLKAAPSFLYVGDSAMYENCVKKAGDLKWLTRVPEKIKEAKTLVQRDVSEFTWNDLGKGYSSTVLTSNYGQVTQRWLLVFSEQAFAREIKTLEKNIVQEKENLDKKLWHLSNQPFACEKDARKAALESVKGTKYYNVEWQVTTAVKSNKKGRPAKDAQTKTEYFITGTATQDDSKISTQKRTKGRFILATNELDKEKLSDEEILPEYKEQSKTESGFRFIKGNALEVSSVFLKKASRIEALMMIMTLCLMVYSVAQYRLREALKQTNNTIPSQSKKPTQKPTMAWVCRLFHGVGVVLLNLASGVQEVVANLNDVTKRIVSYFGTHAEVIYGLKIAE
jgi:transposase